MLSARDLGKTFAVAQKDPGLMGTLRHFVRRKTRDVVAVSGVSFDIQPGELVGFLGANGAGKTTTLKMLSGLIRPTRGEVRVAGHDPFRREASLLCQITLVMGQKQQLIWDLPALDSLRINAAVYEIEPGEAERRVAELGQMLEIAHLLRQPVRKLSLGERMKCELLAALLHQPKVLFLDEPTLGLDLNAQEAIRQFLKSYNQRHGASILLTSHYMADITALCSRVLVIHAGQLIFDGPLHALSERLSPERVIAVRLERPIERQELARFGRVQSSSNGELEISVDRADLRQTVERLFRELDPLDLTIREPPIEAVIAPLLRGQGLPGETGANGASA
jgi:ABC-2 type transport system ATP-binding protein